MFRPKLLEALLTFGLKWNETRKSDCVSKAGHMPMRGKKKVKNMFYGVFAVMFDSLASWSKRESREHRFNSEKWTEQCPRMWSGNDIEANDQGHDQGRRPNKKPLEANLMERERTKMKTNRIR